MNHSFQLIKNLYKRQAGRIVCLLVMLVIGGATITSTGLLVRSQKSYELNKSLTRAGDYDGVFYNVPFGMLDKEISSSDVIESAGSYLEVGMLSQPGSDVMFKGAVFKDKASEEMYHMPCIRGTYPVHSDEVAIDISTAQKMGISPYPGSRIELELYDNDSNPVGTDEYVVVGVFEASADNVWGGWYRYPLDAYNEGEYIVPSIFFCDSRFDQYDSCTETIFVQSQKNADVSSFIDAMYNIVSRSGCDARFEYNDKRVSSYASLLGIFGSIEEKYGEFSYSSISRAIEDGYGIKDFFSSVLIPIICVMVLIIVSTTVYMLVRIIIADRQEYYADLRLVGMSSQKLICDIVIEFLILGVIGTVLGILIGLLTHIAMIRVVSSLCNVKLESGFAVSEAVRTITYDPIVLCIIICALSVIAALILPLFSLCKMTPIELLNEDNKLFVRNTRRHNRKRSRYNDGWLLTLTRRISLHDSITMITLAMVLSVMLFGYLYFCAYSDYSTIEYRSYLKESRIGEFDYVTIKSTQIQDASYKVSNRHSSGISHVSIDRISDYGYTDELFAKISNTSTRIVFEQEPNADLIDLLGGNNIRIQFDDSILGKDGELGQAAVFKAMGYDPDCYMYELPTVGIRPEQLEDLKNYVIAGRIDLDAIASGKEVVVAVPQYLADKAMQYYGVGTKISFSDILLGEDTEELNLNSEEAYEKRYHVYENTITDENGNVISTFASAYGSRHNIETQVGAVVVLDNELCDLYLEPDFNGATYEYDEESGREKQTTTYGMALIVNDKYTFESWGLPDINYTEIRAKIGKDANINDYDQMWYSAMSDSKDVQTVSSFNYRNKMHSDVIETMVIYYLMAALLVAMGAMAVTIGLYTRISINSDKIQTLRRLGLSVRQGGLLIVLQNIYYPFVAAVISIIPVYLCQNLFMYIRKKLESGEWESSYTGNEPWYVSLPYRYNLFDYNFISALAVCLLTGILLIILGSIPQIRYLRKHKMITEEE